MDKIEQIRRECRKTEWAKQVTECRSSGKSVKEWCQENSINRKTYYYRQRAIQEQLCERFAGSKQTIVPVGITAPTTQTMKIRAAMTIHMSNVHIEIIDGTSKETIAAVIGALLQNGNDR